MTTGIYPGARQASGFGANTHYTPGNKGRLAVVLHICEGAYQGSIAYLRSIGLSSHFVVSEGGEVSQLVNVNDTAWANGLSYEGGKWYSPRPRHKVVTPTWKRLTPGMDSNGHTISIEHAGYHNKPRPNAQIQATINLLRWLGSQFPSLMPYAPGVSLIGHFNLDNLDRANCPGVYFDFAGIAAAANTQAGRYRVRGLAVYQRQDLTGALAGELPSGAQVTIDQTYSNGAGHLSSGLGFVRMSDLEAV